MQAIRFYYRYAVIALILFVMCGIWACAERSSSIDNTASDEELKGLEQRIKILDVKYDILLKDSPPQNETIEFRLSLSDARKAIKDSRADAAETEIQKAESWIDSTRATYHQKHKEKVINKTTDKAPADYASESLVFLKKAREAEDQGDLDIKDLYLQAALEQAELGVLIYINEPEKAIEYLQASMRLSTIYKEAGKTQQAQEAETRGLENLKSSIYIIRDEVLSCLEGRRDRCRKAILRPGPDTDTKHFRETKKWLISRNELLKTISENGHRYYPGQVPLYDYSKKIEQWSDYWESMWKQYTDRGGGETPQEEYEKEQAERRERYRIMVEEHNRKYCQGGIPSSSSQTVDVVYQNIELRGNRVVVKGHVTNISEEPIYNPKVTICGSVISGLERLGFYNLNPQNIGGFTLELKDFGVDEFREFGFKVPAYKIMLIYQDYYGTDHKVYLAVNKQ